MDNNEMKKELLKRIEDSTLSNEDKDIWRGALNDAPEEIVLVMHSFFLDYGDKLEEATDFLKRKIGAIKNKDVTAWNNVLKDEENFINKS